MRQIVVTTEDSDLKRSVSLKSDRQNFREATIRSTFSPRDGERWYIGTNNPETYYLHHDGTWHLSTQSGGEYPGLYSTKEEAEKVFSKFCQPKD